MSKAEQDKQHYNSPIIKIGQKFHPFNKSDVRLNSIPGIIYHSELKLETGIQDFPTLPVQISASFGQMFRKETITPINPQFGYQFSSQDIYLASRIARFNQSRDQNKVYVNEIVAPFLFYSKIDSKDLLSLGLVYCRGNNYKFNPELISITDRMRMQLLISESSPHTSRDDPNYHPPMSLEAQPEYMFYGGVAFNLFYPLETGPLPCPKKLPTINTKSARLREGFRIGLPDDYKKLSEIEARYILLASNDQTEQHLHQPDRPKYNIFSAN